MTILHENILPLIPQRPPFVMVDSLVSCDDVRSHTRLTVKKENVLVFNGELSEAGLIENIAQTAAAGVGYANLQKGLPVFTGYIGAIKNLEVFALPKTGDVIDTVVTIENQVFDVTIIAGAVRRNDELLAKCEMKIFIQNNNTQTKID